MSRLTPVSRGEFIQRMLSLGFDGPYAGGQRNTGGRVLDLALRPAPTLHLRVSDAAGKAYQGWPTLTIIPVEGSGTAMAIPIQTDAEGRAAYRRSLPGICTIRFREQGVGEAREAVRIEAGGTALEVTLR